MGFRAMSDEEVIYRGYRLFVHPFDSGWRVFIYPPGAIRGHSTIPHIPDHGGRAKVIAQAQQVVDNELGVTQR
jgi:hypothetical protein